jgi:hypothetical protein
LILVAFPPVEFEISLTSLQSWIKFQINYWKCFLLLTKTHACLISISNSMNWYVELIQLYDFVYDILSANNPRDCNTISHEEYHGQVIILLTEKKMNKGSNPLYANDAFLLKL